MVDFSEIHIIRVVILLRRKKLTTLMLYQENSWCQSVTEERSTFSSTIDCLAYLQIREELKLTYNQSRIFVNCLLQDAGFSCKIISSDKAHVTFDEFVEKQKSCICEGENRRIISE